MIEAYERLQYHMEIEEFLIEEKFYSKKNEVYKIKYVDHGIAGQKVVVLKKYLQPIGKRRKEIKLLRHLEKKGLSVPKVYIETDDYLIMEFIEGETLLDAIENREKRSGLQKGRPYESNQKLISSLLEWMEKFYLYTNGKMILRDINLRNFIVNKEGAIYGFDFEDCSQGRLEEDGGKLCSYILTYDPAFTPWKLEFTKEVFQLFANKFQINKEVLLEEMEKEITNINKKRRKNYSLHSFSNTIE